MKCHTRNAATSHPSIPKPYSDQVQHTLTTLNKSPETISKGFTPDKILKMLTGRSYSADTYKYSRPFDTETSLLIVIRKDGKKMGLNADIGTAIQSKLPENAFEYLYFACESVGISYNVETGVIWLALYAIRGVPDLCESEYLFAHVFIAMTNKDGDTSYRYVEEDEWFEEMNDELPPPPSPESHKKRASPTPVCRIEADTLGDDILKGIEDVDWHAERPHDCQYGERSFWPVEGGGRLVLKQDFSVIHADLKPGFEFDHLVISNGRNVKIVVGDDKTGKVYKLKLNALELVAGDE